MARTEEEGTTRGRTRALALVPVAFAILAVGCLFWLSSGVDPADGTLGFFIAVVIWNVFPFVILALTLALLKRPAWLWWTALVYSILAGLLWVVAIVLVLADESSTAALGILAIPVGVLGGMVPAVVVGFVAARIRA